MQSEKISTPQSPCVPAADAQGGGAAIGQCRESCQACPYPKTTQAGPGGGAPKLKPTIPQAEDDQVVETMIRGGRATDEAGEQGEQGAAKGEPEGEAPPP